VRLTSRVVLDIWSERLSQRGLHPKSVKSYLKQLSKLTEFINERYSSRWDWRNLSREDGLAFLQWLEAKGWAYTTKRLCFKAALWVTSFLWKNERLLKDPWDGLNMVYKKNKVRMSMDEEEIQRFLDSIEGQDFLTLRDRTMFELLYSSGLRALEVCKIREEDVDLESRLLKVRQSKFSKDRVVPITSVAIRWIKRYLPLRQGEFLFGVGGRRPLSTNTLLQRYHKWAEVAGVVKKGLTVHSIRHSCATHLLQHGADIRYVQKLLGHESVETTVLYTKEKPNYLKKWYRQHHPRENILYKEMDEGYLRKIREFAMRQEKTWERRVSRRS
jgi:integrase/recombinase XerD